MTSIADWRREPTPLAWLRGGLLVLFLLLGALGMPGKWGLLWLLVPALTTVSLLLGWRFGRPALLVPLALLIGVGLTALARRADLPLWWTAWLPLASFVGTWMGLREEGGGAGLGEKAWMMFPLLLFAAALPVTPGFPAAATRLDREVQVEQQRALASLQSGQVPEWWGDVNRKAAGMSAGDRQQWALAEFPNAMFVWMVLLVGVGRALAGRAATLLRWPPLSRSPFVYWRLPDAALAPLITGIALFAFADRSWHPSALTLLVHVVLGYSVQGMAVVESVLLSRGMSPVLVTLALMFVIVVSLLWVLPVVAVVGLSDVWRDYRRLEPSPAGEA